MTCLLEWGRDNPSLTWHYRNSKPSCFHWKITCKYFFIPELSVSTILKMVSRVERCLYSVSSILCSMCCIVRTEEIHSISRCSTDTFLEIFKSRDLLYLRAVIFYAEIPEPAVVVQHPISGAGH